MRVNFNSARKNLARSFNKLSREINEEYADRAIPENVLEPLREMRQQIGLFLCMFDDSDPKDCDDLSETIELVDIDQFELELHNG